MNCPDCEIDLYRPDQASRVVDLLGDELWQGTTEQNLAYFKWKFHDNPYTSCPLGIVARKGEDIVGFRGYFATNWYLSSTDNKITVLIPGDTVVRPDYRRKGLSVSMGHMAMERFASSSSVFLNTTASRNSVPGYLRMGFMPLHNKTYHRRSAMIGNLQVMVKRALKRKSEAEDLPIERAVALGEFDDITVTTGSRPQDMHRVIAGDPNAPDKITLLQDERFFRWRYANPKGKYVFYFSNAGSQIVGYVVLRISADSKQGFVIDYAQSERGQIGKILNHIASNDRLTEVNFLNTGVNEPISGTLKAQGFKSWDIQSWAKKRVFGDRPLMVRPVKQDCFEADWYIEGLDIRDISSWQFKEICQDNV